MSLLGQIFTWWDGQTIGTRFHTWRRGKKVGTDSLGNAFYESADGARRWVIFSGEIEASRIGAEWFGWLHHTWQEPPTEAPQPRTFREQPHVPVTTGTTAYRPVGSLLAERPVVRQDYEAWSPE